MCVFQRFQQGTAWLLEVKLKSKDGEMREKGFEWETAQEQEMT